MLTDSTAGSTTSLDTEEVSSSPTMGAPVNAAVLNTTLNLFDHNWDFTMPQLAIVLQQRFKKASIPADANLAYIGSWENLNTVYTDFSKLPDFITNLEELRLIPDTIPGAPDKETRVVIDNFVADLHRIFENRYGPKDRVTGFFTIIEQAVNPTAKAYNDYLRRLPIDGGDAFCKSTQAVALERFIGWLQFTIKAQPKNISEILEEYLGSIDSLTNIYWYSSDNRTLIPSTISRKIHYDLKKILAALPKNGQEKLQAALCSIKEKLPAPDESVADHEFQAYRKQKEAQGGALEALHSVLHRLNTNEVEQSLPVQIAVQESVSAPIPADRSGASAAKVVSEEIPFQSELVTLKDQTTPNPHSPIALFNIPFDFTMQNLRMVFKDRLEAAGIEASAILAFIGNLQYLSTNYANFSQLPAFIIAVTELAEMHPAIPGALQEPARAVIQKFLQDLHNMLEWRCLPENILAPGWTPAAEPYGQAIADAYNAWKLALPQEADPFVKSKTIATLERAIDWLQRTCKAQPASVLDILTAYLGPIDNLLEKYRFTPNRALVSTQVLYATIAYDVDRILTALPAHSQDALKASLKAIQAILPISEDEKYIAAFKQARERNGAIENLAAAFGGLSGNPINPSTSNPNNADLSANPENVTQELATLRDLVASYQHQQGAEAEQIAELQASLHNMETLLQTSEERCQQAESTLGNRQALLFSVAQSLDSIDARLAKASDKVSGNSPSQPYIHSEHTKP